VNKGVSQIIIFVLIRNGMSYQKKQVCMLWLYHGCCHIPQVPCTGPGYK